MDEWKLQFLIRGEWQTYILKTVLFVLHQSSVYYKVHLKVLNILAYSI